MSNKSFLENNLNLNQLNIKPEFQFDVNYRNKFNKISEDSYNVQMPFQKTIDKMLKVS